MPLIPILGLSNLLSQVNGTPTSNLTNAGASQSNGATSNAALINAFDNLLQQLAAASGTIANTAAPSVPSVASNASTTSNTSSAGGAGATSSVSNLESTLNQLLQNLKLSAGSANAAAGSVAAAQSPGAQQQLLARVRHLAEQKPHIFVAPMVNAVA